MDGQVHEQVLKARKKETGCTIHIVDIGVDTGICGLISSLFVMMTSSVGPIVCQKKCTVDENDTADSLKAKVQALEGKETTGVVVFLENVF
jgi:phosphoribosylglycinamide formyltransferase 1